MNTKDNILNVVLIQYDIEWESTSVNLIKIENMLENEAYNSDLIILPEMFNSGFSMYPSKIAETMQGETVKWMKNIALKYNSVIAGSVAIKENENYFNRFLAAFPNGKIEKYNKRHLFRMSGEEKVYTAGNQQLVIDINGWRCALFVCYDLRFPVWARNRNNYDLALFIANWPAVRCDVWKTLLKARSLENQCYVAGVNRVGKGNDIDYNGHSLVYDFKGDIIGSLQENNEGLIFAELSMDALVKFRKTFPAWMDADEFILHYS